MGYRFLYVDDTRDSLEQGMINALQSEGDINITFKGPKDWEDLLTTLKTEIPNHNGVILDLRLDDVQYSEGKTASYKGSTVAQELRNLTKEGKLGDFPIVLFSGTDKLDQYLDPTSKDLFDKIIDKTKIEQSEYLDYQDFRNILRWLSDGYDCVKNISRSNLNEILAIGDTAILDPRFVDCYNELKEKPTHIIVHFILKQILGKPSFLVKEDFLSARLGVNRGSKDWERLKEYFVECKYRGCFSNYHSYWWMPLVSKFWKENVSSEFNMRNISARKRVELLIASTGIQGLEPISKYPRSKSESFWTICKARNVAIDTVDGFIISGQDNKFPWQEVEYICIEEALRSTKPYTVSPIEISRLKNLKSVVEKNEQRVRR